jgi:MFS family permease
MCLISGPISFYGLRLLLGIAEAGFFPGIILYLTYWYPRERRAQIVSAFFLAIPLSNGLGSPLSAALLGLEGRLGLHGWQWMFLLEGAPAVLVGLAALRWLPDGPARARWLSPEERTWLSARIASDAGEPAPVGHLPLWRLLTNRRVLLAAIIYAGGSGASSCLTLWAPQFLKSFGVSTLATGWLNALPYMVAVPLMLLWGRHSDGRGERVWHTALPLALIAVSLALMSATPSLATTVALLCLAVTGTYALKGPFWALSTEWLSAAAAAAGIAQINAIGNLGGFVATSAMGAIKQGGGSYAQGLLPLAAITALSALMLVGFGGPGRTRPSSQPSFP